MIPTGISDESEFAPRLCVKLAFFIAAAFVITGCHSGGSAVVAEPSRVGAAAPASDNAVEIEPDMLDNIRIEPVRRQAVRRVLTGTGKIQLNEDQTVRVLAPLPGQVLNFKVRVGDRVRKDQLLFTIKSREIASLVTAYLESQQERDLARKTYNMTKDLFDHEAASRISLQQAETDLAKAEARVARADETLRVLGIDSSVAARNGGLQSEVPVLAPAGGTVIERNLTPGQFVQADSTALLTVADLTTLWVMVDIFERDIHLIRVGQKVQVTAAAYPDRHFTAHVERIGDKVDPESRTLKVRLLVANPDLSLKPEMFITASVELSGDAPGLTVPPSAVFTEGPESFLFVRAGERRFERRPVSAAPDGEGRLRVTKGLQYGDQVVTDGAMLLRLRQKQKQR